MGYDLLVWNTKERLTHADAGELLGRILEEDFTDLVASPKLDAFYGELTGRYPEIGSREDAEELDRCPWSGEIERSSGHLRMECVWSRADEVDFQVRSLAAKHGLAVYDPQQMTVMYPDHWDARDWKPVEAPPEWKNPGAFMAKRPWWRFWGH